MGSKPGSRSLGRPVSSFLKKMRPRACYIIGVPCGQAGVRIRGQETLQSLAHQGTSQSEIACEQAVSMFRLYSEVSYYALKRFSLSGKVLRR